MPKIKVKRKKRRGGFLNRNNFAQAMRNAVNTGLSTIEIIDPSFTENAKQKIGKATEKRVVQIIGQSEKELERVTPVTLKKIIEQKLLQKIHFRLLGKLSRKKNMCVFKKLNIIKRTLPRKSQG